MLKKMVAGVFVYLHLFSTQKTNVSDLLTSDSPAIFLNRLVSVLLAVATLPLWEGLFRHTDLTPSSEKIDLNGGQCPRQQTIAVYLSLIHI